MNETRIAKGLIVCLTFSALGIGHLSLQFALREMKLQHKAFQGVAMELHQRSDQLRRENETLCEISRLHRFGLEDLQMVETSPGKAVTVDVDQALYARYHQTNSQKQGPVKIEIASRDGQDSKFQRLLNTMFEPDRAYAQDNPLPRR